MVGPKLTKDEQKMADTILNQMGLDQSDKYKDDIQSTLNREYEEHQDFYENSNIVEKPEFIKNEEKFKENFRKGQIINGEGLKPLKNCLIAKMYNDREKKTKSGIILADLRPVKQDNPDCEVVGLNKNTDYDFKIGDRIVIDLR